MKEEFQFLLYNSPEAKGFAMDDERLKQGQTAFGKDYFRELLERTRSIRAGEHLIWQQRLCGTVLITKKNTWGCTLRNTRPMAVFSSRMLLWLKIIRRSMKYAAFWEKNYNFFRGFCGGVH